jgi:hypothetical protein
MEGMSFTKKQQNTSCLLKRKGAIITMEDFKYEAGEINYFK